jgi:hypothetical protein
MKTDWMDITATGKLEENLGMLSYIVKNEGFCWIERIHLLCWTD